MVFWDIVKTIGKEVSKDVVTGTAENFKSDFTSVLIDTVSDTIHSMIAGEESIEEWAETVVKGIDPIITNTVIENEWQYVGGKLQFAFSQKYNDKIDISFELYFLDNDKQWHKEAAKSDVYSSTFTEDSLEELRKSGMIEYEIEG